LADIIWYDGCHMGTTFSRICQKENELRQACEITGDLCGASGQGKCVADGMCCDLSKRLWRRRARAQQDPA